MLKPYYGKDATQAFYALHKENILDKYSPKLVIGHVEGEEVIETQDAGNLCIQLSSARCPTENPLPL